MSRAKTALPRRLRRDESFLGMHFDYHMRSDCHEVGKTVTPGMIKRLIVQVRPDYIQVDCKGHRGISSYPTKVGHPAPGFVRDQLRIWRDVTAQHGVALYMHYSGVADDAAIKKHPSWARVDENGTRDPRSTSVFGPYVDKLLIPQLKELGDEYGVDGIWLDGECWAVKLDYGKKVIAAFRRQTGIRSVPKKPTDEHFSKFLEFCREGFRSYLNHYVSALHQHNPQLQITSNWAYTSLMPEPVEVALDFLSGDYSLQNAVNAARLESRIMARQGKAWDLMAWSFGGKFEELCFSTKTVVQLQQEAAVVLAKGGGFQAYFKQKADGSINEWEMKLMAEVARFCRARQEICHQALAVPQVAVLCSGSAIYRRNALLFQLPEHLRLPMQGVMQCLLDGQYSVEVLMEHHLSGRMGEYPMIVVPEWDYLKPSFKRELLQYVETGGRLLLVGPKAAAMFKGPLRISLRGPAQEKNQWLEHDGWLCGLKTMSQRVKPDVGVKVLGKLYTENDNQGPFEPAATITKHGRGMMAATYFDVGERYCRGRTTVVRDFMQALVRNLCPRPMVEVTGSRHVDVVVNRKDGRLLVNLVNTAGPHADPDVYTFDEVPVLGPLEVVVRTGRPPKTVTLCPANRKLKFTYKSGRIELTLTRLHLHEVIVIS